MPPDTWLLAGDGVGWGGMGPGCQASPDRPPRGAPATPGTPHCEEPLAPGHLALLCVGGRADGKTYPKWNLETGIKFVFTLTLGKILPGSNREKKIKKIRKKKKERETAYKKQFVAFMRGIK